MIINWYNIVRFLQNIIIIFIIIIFLSLFLILFYILLWFILIMIIKSKLPLLDRLIRPTLNFILSRNTKTKNAIFSTTCCIFPMIFLDKVLKTAIHILFIDYKTPTTALITQFLRIFIMSMHSILLITVWEYLIIYQFIIVFIIQIFLRSTIFYFWFIKTFLLIYFLRFASFILYYFNILTKFVIKLLCNILKCFIYCH